MRRISHKIHNVVVILCFIEFHLNPCELLRWILKWMYNLVQFFFISPIWDWLLFFYISLHSQIYFDRIRHKASMLFLSSKFDKFWGNFQLDIDIKHRHNFKTNHLDQTIIYLFKSRWYIKNETECKWIKKNVFIFKSAELYNQSNI